MRNDLPTAPDHLSADAKAFWARTVAAFMFEDHHLEILAQACACLDRISECRTAIAEDGVTTKDRFEQTRANPACELEVKYLRTFKAHLRELQLDVEPKDAGYDRAPRLVNAGRVAKHA